MKNSLVALYLRLSLEDVGVRGTGNKDESDSITNQRSIGLSFIQSHPELSKYKVIEFVDDGYTGTNFDRPDFKRMMEMVRSGEIICIVVKDFSRFARNYIDAGDYLEHIFPMMGVRFISINDHYDSNNYIGTTGGMDVAFRNFMHELHSLDTSKKVKKAQHMLMQKGKYVTHCPYGYTKPKGKKHKMIIDPETAPVVRDIFRWAIEGKKTTEIARILNERKIPTPMQYKNLSRKDLSNDAMWSHQSVLRIIKDYKYTGAMVTFKCYNETIRAKAQKRNDPKDYVVHEDMHEAIVSHDDYYAANDSLRKVKDHIRVPSDLHDRVFYCGHCGRRLRKTFGTDVYYSCATQMYIKGAVCAEIRLRKTDIEEILLSTYKRQLQIISEQYRKEIEASRPDVLSPLKTKHKSLSVQIKGIGGEVTSLYEKYRSDALSREDFLRIKGELAEEKKKMQDELAKIESEIEHETLERQKNSAMLQTMADIANAPEVSDDDLRRRMYDDIEKVIVFDNDTIDIVWKLDVDFNSS